MYEGIMKTIQKAKTRCMSEEELISLITQKPYSLYNSYPNAVYGLSKMDLSEKSIKRLKDLIDQIMIMGEMIKSKEKPKVDSYLKRLVDLMPESYGYEYAVKFIKHKRKNRRGRGIALLKHCDLGSSEIRGLLNIAKDNSDEELFKIVARNISKIDIEEEDILVIIESFDEDYWNCRIIEEIVKRKGFNDFTKELINTYPIAAIRAMGRSKDVGYLPHILPDIYNYFNDEDTLGLLFWALGEIGAIDTIKLLEDKFNEYSEIV